MSTTVSSSKPINYREVYFRHGNLTKIEGNPTYKNIQHLYKEVKANAASVPTTLGGGNHGHLGLVQDNTTYARISPTAPYVRPTLPAALLPPAAGMTQHQIAERQRLYDLDVATFHEVTHIERTLLNQIGEAVNDTVLAAKLNDDTGVVEGTVVEIIQYLFQEFGNITDQQLAEAKNKVMQHKYIHDDPISNVFQEIHKYSLMAEAHGTPETSAQLIAIGKIIITNAAIFGDAVEKWNNKPPADKTWATFKTHFSKAQRDYKAARPTATLADQGFINQANVVDQIMQLLDTQRQEEAAMAAQEEADRILQEHHQQATANATTEKKELQDLRDTVDKLTKLMTNPDNDRWSSRGGDRGRGGRNGYRGRLRDITNAGRQSQTKNSSYCWTHGACNHQSKDCENPADGHKKTATFQNMMKGSTKRCFWLDTKDE